MAFENIPDYSSKFTNSNNVYRTKELFYELAQVRDSILYTLKKKDTDQYPSLYRLYMEVADPTEYRFANEYFDGWEHWQNIANSTWFKPYIEKWRNELEVKIRSEALASIMAESKSNSRSAFTAAKYIADGWGEKPIANRRGRPSKDEIKRAANEMVHDRARIEEDYARLQ